MRGIRLGNRAAALVMAAVVGLSSLQAAGAAETEPDEGVLRQAVLPDAETEDDAENRLPDAADVVLAGPTELNEDAVPAGLTELNGDTKGLFADGEDLPDGGMQKDAISPETEEMAEDMTETGYGEEGMPAILSEWPAGDPDGAATEADRDGGSVGEEGPNGLPEAGDGGGMDDALRLDSANGCDDAGRTASTYDYKDSMTFGELSRLPEETAGAATEVDTASVRSLKKGASLMSAASEGAYLWTCADYYVNEPDLFSVRKTEDFPLKYQIEFHTSTDLDAGSVQIRVPEALLTDRGGNRITPGQTGVPQGTVQAPSESLNSPFNWYRDTADGSLVFFNYRPVISGTNTAFQVLYPRISVLDIPDGSEWSLTPQIRVTLPDGTVQERLMETLDGSIDTKAELLSASADAFSDGSISCMPALYTKDQVQRVLGGGLPAWVSALGEEWLFIAWQIDCQGFFSQPWELGIDVNLSAGGAGEEDLAVVGSVTRITGTAEGAGGGGIVSRYAAQEEGARIAQLSSRDLSRYVQQGMFHLTTTAVTAVRRQCLQDQSSVLGLEAALLLTPSDGMDEQSSLQARAAWTFSDYKWKYKGNMVGIGAWSGSVGGDGSVTYASRTVSLSGWLNEYRLAGLTGREAGTVPLRVQSECRGYALTHETEGGLMGSYKPGSGYEVTTADDAIYLLAQSQDEEMGPWLLGSGDYYYAEVSVSIRDRGMDPFEDRTCAPMTDQECPGADRTTKIYAMYEDSDGWELAAQLPWDSSGRISYVFPKALLRRGVWRVKVVHNAADYDSVCTIDSRLCIRPDSPVCAALLSEEDPDGLVLFKAEHLGAVMARSLAASPDGWFHEDSGAQYDEAVNPGLAGMTSSLYGVSAMRANSYAELTSVRKHAKARKTVSVENDPSAGCVRMTCSIGALEGYRIYSAQAADLIAKGDNRFPSPCRSSYDIYDLLPEGVLFDPSAPVKAGLVMGEEDRYLVTPSLWDGRAVSVRVDPHTGVVPDWKGSGRTMVILRMTIHTETERIARMGSGMWLNGVGVQFGTYCPYRDLKRMKTMPNIAAVMPSEGCQDPVWQILGTDAEVSCDDGIVLPYTGEEKEQLEVFGADIDSDGVTDLRTVLYAFASPRTDTAVSLTDGITVLVKPDRKEYSEWEKSAVVGAEDPYTYRIDVTNSSAQPVHELVVAAHLETAARERAQAESGRAFDDETWTGVLESVDTDGVRRMGIEPVLWLSRDVNAPLPGEGHPPDSVLTPENGWTRLEDWTGDMGEARSVAVDLRRREDGSLYFLEMGDSVHILLHMHAPGIGDGEGQTRAEHAYQCASFYSISEDEPDGDLVVANAVEVALAEKSALIIEKVLTNGEEDPAGGKERFLFRLSRNGRDAALYAYRLEERRKGDAEEAVWEDDGNLHTTSREGLFSLSAGQRAVFEEEPGVQELSAREILSACYESSMTQEDTPAGRVCRFENTWYPPLYLTKKILGFPEDTPLPEDVFRVRVSAGGESMSGRKYWTVDPEGEFLENQIIEEHLVDEDSCVLLHPGEVIALHPGGVDCTYEAAEEEDCYGEGTDYVPVTVRRSGSLKVEGASVTLENAWRWKELVLRKEVLHRELSLCRETFSFRLWKMHDGTDASAFDPENPYLSADPAAGAEGSMEQEIFTADENGVFALACAGKDVVLRHLEAQKTYVIQEINVPADYETVNGGLAFAGMPLLGVRKYVTVQNSWKKRSLEVSKSVLSGIRENRTTVFSPGYPGNIRAGENNIALGSYAPPGMTGFTVSFPNTLKLIGDERIRVEAGGVDIDSFTGTIAAGSSRTYSGYAQVSFYLWGLTQEHKEGFFFFFCPRFGQETQEGTDMGGREFTFLLEAEDASGALRPASFAEYQRSDGQTLSANAQGFFTLPGGMSARFTDLAAEGCRWRVTETPAPDCPQVYPADREAWNGILGDRGEDT